MYKRQIFDGVMEEGYPEAEEKGGYEDTVVMMFTSGTSSASKAVMLTNYSYMHAAATYRKLFDITEKDSTVIPLSLIHILTLFVSEKTSFLIPPINCLVMTALFHWIGCKLFKQTVNYNDWCDEEAREEAFAAPTYEELVEQNVAYDMEKEIG